METLEFFGDWNENKRYPAISFGLTWNGWSTPTVTRETFAELMSDSPGYGLTFADDGTATVSSGMPYGEWNATDNDPEPEYAVIVPDAAGNYDLRALGWTFITPDYFSTEGN